MATSVHPESETDDYDVWTQAFNEETRRQLLHDDRVAFRSMCGILVGIVTLGLLIGILAVVIAA
ncbi:MAG: hypothetical protein IH991_04035 [Planctomycetes bacterium]|nr:hypothetical protein [Planctomycetota bacterium]